MIKRTGTETNTLIFVLLHVFLWVYVPVSFPFYVSLFVLATRTVRITSLWLQHARFLLQQQRVYLTPNESVCVCVQKWMGEKGLRCQCRGGSGFVCMCVYTLLLIFAGSGWVLLKLRISLELSLGKKKTVTLFLLISPSLLFISPSLPSFLSSFTSVSSHPSLPFSWSLQFSLCASTTSFCTHIQSHLREYRFTY